MYWFRACARRIAATLLVSVVTVGGSMVAPHADDCHEACQPGSVAHDASAHAFSAPGQDEGSHPLHCLVCHWARSFRPPTEVRFVSAPAIQAGARVHVESLTVARVATVAQPPLRSPPASPALA